MACARCDGRQYQIVRRGDFAAALRCECVRDCPRCKGAGHVYATREETFSEKTGKRTYEVLVPCSCQVLDARISNFNRASLPGVLSHARFENFQGVPYVEQARALQLTRDFAYGYTRAKPNHGFIISGPVGAGKTHLLFAALSHLMIELGVEARYIEISLLYATIRRGFQQNKSGGEIIGPLSEVEVLAIDELGKGRGSQFEMETLDELIARRYNAGRTTLFATNYSLAPERKSVRTHRDTEDLKAAGREEQLLAERVGPRIYSRLCEMCQFIELPSKTPDFRRTRQEVDTRGRR